MTRLGDLELGAVPRIAVAITDADLPSASAWAPLTDVIELRVDLCTRRDAAAAVELARAAQELGKPLVATVRWSAEGGGGELSDAARLALYDALAPLADGLDVELASTLCGRVVGLARQHGKLAIVSAHDFSATPSPEELAARLADGTARGDVVKIAATASDAGDLARLFDLLRAPGGPRIVIGMGTHANASRVFFPLLGSLLTYSFAGTPTAPGQLGLTELYDALRQFSPAFAATHAAR